MRLALPIVLALALTACTLDTAAQAPVDLTPVTEAVAALEQQVVTLSAQVEVLNGRIVALDDNVRARMSELAQAATDLGAVVNQPLDLSKIDYASVELLIVTTSADVLPSLVIEPGACADGLEVPRNRVQDGEAIVTVAWPAPAGLHCISYTSESLSFGAVVDVPAGAIGGVTLLAPLE